MGCSGRVKAEDIRPEQKWEFISLNDFHSTSCFKPFAYAYLWLSLAISVAVYAVDTFTAINLLAFDKWSSEIRPFIPVEISKWIFSACIIASLINLGFEHLRAWRVMQRGAVAESFLDSLAVRLQSIRFGKGRGWRRFLVFAELTKSKKGAEYVALFTYFSFQSWIRIIFCQGPRQVINALTLYSVFKAQFDTTKDDVGSSILQFFHNLGILADKEHQQAVILSGMVFTLVIWVFGALSLFLAMIFYVLFLWHYIPDADGGLSGYCERKVNRRLARIVSAKVNKAIEEEERRRLKGDAKSLKKGELPTGRQATLPTLFNSTEDDKLPQMPMINRNDTMTTLPQYSSRPGTPSSSLPVFELSKIDIRPSTLGLNDSTSVANFGVNVSLISNASDMGYTRSASPAPSHLLSLDTQGYPGIQRPGTSNSTWSARGALPTRMQSAMVDRGYTSSPVSYTDAPQSVRNNRQDHYGRPIPRALEDTSGRSNSMGRRNPFDHSLSSSSQSIYEAYNGSQRSASAATNRSRSISREPYRNMTDVALDRGSNRSDSVGGNNVLPMSRPGTAGPMRPGTASSMRPSTAQRGNLRLQPPGSIPRLASPAPYNTGSSQGPEFGSPMSPPGRGYDR